MDICVLNPYFYPQPGGTEHVLLDLYSRLAKEHNVTVVTSSLNRKDSEKTEYVGSIRVVRLHTKYHDVPGLPLPFLEMRELKEKIQEIGADIYHLNNRYQYFSETVNTIRKTGRLVLTIHNALPKGIDALTDSVGFLFDVVWGRKLMIQADLITAVSKYTLDGTVPHNLHHKSVVIHNGVDYKRFMPRSKSSKEVSALRSSLGFDDHRVILNCARLVTQKGQRYLIRAVSELRKDKEYEDLKLAIIGKGPLKKKLHTEAKKMHMADSFRIFSDVEADRIPYFYNMADAFSMPSLYEPAGLSVMEAMASGTTSVVSRTGGIPEIAKDTVYYTKVKGVEQIKKRLAMILDDKKLSESMAKRGRLLVKKEHDWDTIAKQYEAEFEKILKR